MTEQTKLSDYVFQFLAGEGVENVFLLSGGGCMHLVDSLGRNPDLAYTCCLHEQAAAVAAAAYGQYRNDLGVALVTTGPGGTNAITGALGAWTDSVPLLILSGQVKRMDMKGDRSVRMLGYQEADIISMVKPITKYAVTVQDPESIHHHLTMAVNKARQGRPGPVWLDIPLDVQAAMIDASSFSKPRKTAETLPSESTTTAARSAASMLHAAQRPVLLVGKGIALAGAEKHLESLRQALPIPTLATWRAMDLLDEEDDLYFGRPGNIGQRAANFIQQNADLILSIGARLDFGQIGFDHGNFARAAQKIIVDIEPDELQKFSCPVDLPACCDAGEFLVALLSELKASPTLPPCESWRDQCREWYQRYPVVLPRHRELTEYVSTYALAEALSEAMTAEDVFVPGSSGAGIDIPMQAFRIKKGQRLVAFPGIGAMGFGLPSTIGTCIASKRRRTVCTNGDGGFQLNIQDLETVSRLGLPIKYFVLNNAGYGSIKATQRNYFAGHYVASGPASGVTLPDICRVAEAYGIEAHRIANHEEMARVLPQVLAGAGPALCEVMIDPEETTEFRTSSVVRADGSMVSRPQEDLSPFLPREEFRENMIVDPLPE